MPEIENEPLVYRKMMEFKRGLLGREGAQMREMARRWRDMERALEGQFELAARELADAKAAGRATGSIWRLGRTQELLRQVRVELGRYVDYADRRISSEQETLGELGLVQAAEGIETGYADYGITATFDRLPAEAVENMVGIAGNGGPLRDLLRERLTPGVGDLERLTDVLVKGTGLGWNPVKTARGMADELAEGLDKALTIARTEQMRVYNAAKAEEWRASGVVVRRVRICAHDERTCAACLALDGSFLELEDVLIDHPKGRCTDAPVVAGVPTPRWLAGEEWLRTQDEGVQESILGKGRAEAWRRGEVDFPSLAVVEENDWGGTVRVAASKTMA